MLDEKDEKIRPSEEANANSDISRRLHILCCTVRLDEARDLKSVTTRLRKRSGTRAQSRKGCRAPCLPFWTASEVAERHYTRLEQLQGG